MLRIIRGQRCAARSRSEKKYSGAIIPDVARSLNNLADLHERQRCVADAVALYQRAQAIREQTVDPVHPDTATSLNNLASFCQVQGRTADALPIVERTIAAGRPHLHVTLPVLSDAQR